MAWRVIFCRWQSHTLRYLYMVALEHCEVPAAACTAVAARSQLLGIQQPILKFWHRLCPQGSTVAAHQCSCMSTSTRSAIKSLDGSRTVPWWLCWAC